MKTLYANFTDSTVNYGNYIIERATRQVLEPYLRDEDVEEFDSFKDDIPRGEFERLLIPGCTMITPGQNKSLKNLNSLGYKSYCLAGSLWYPTKEKNILIKKRVINLRKNKVKPDFSIVNDLDGIIGCRDVYTYQALKNKGLNGLYTGCPTLFLDSEGVEEGDYVLFSFGRHDFHKQVYYGSKLAKKHKVIGIVHEKNDARIARAAGWDLPLIDFIGDLDLYLSYFKKAMFVVTGRLHGVLPALAYGKPSFYFGTNDSRTTILHHLGLNIHGYSDIPNFEEKLSKVKNNHTLDYFKNNLDLVAQSIFKNRI